MVKSISNSCIEKQSKYYFAFLWHSHILNHFSISIAVAPVVPELTRDDDTSNFEDVMEPDGTDETFELTKVSASNYFIQIRFGALFYSESLLS